MIFGRKRRIFSACLRLSAWLGAICAAPLLAAAAPAAPSSTGSIVVEYNPTAKRIGVSVDSPSPELARVMRWAFNIHGAFNLVAAASADYALHFTATGPTEVTAVAESKKAAGVSFQVVASGKNATDAAYRAADAVVEKLTQAPGFFAGKLAFVSTLTKYREIYTSDIAGQSVTQLTSDHSISANPRWSPDGTKLLYTGYYRSGFPDIILYNLATTTRSAFAAYVGTNTGGAFSPDGKSVAMILSSKEGGMELYVSDAEGKNVHRLTHDDPRHPASKSSPTWSPDGKQIILSCDPQGGLLLYQIAATGGPLRLVQDKVYAYSAEAAWNPRDQNVIAFSQQMLDGTMQVLTFNFKTGEVKVLTNGSEPCWANDGRHIFYAKHLKGVDRLYIVDSITKKDSQMPMPDASDPTFVYVK